MTPEEAKQYLNSFIDFEYSLDKLSKKNFNLNRMQMLIRAFGQPHQDLRIIHVAGSKGKGSTCAMIANILKEAGYQTFDYHE